MRIIIIGGAAGSGKNTLGILLKEQLQEYGYKPCVMRLTETLYSYAKNYFNWNECEEKPREFLQKMGIEIIKEKLNKKTFLIDRTMEDIEILSEFFDTFIITDARLKEEFIEFDRRFSDVTKILLFRENYDNGLDESLRNHITEKDLNDFDDFDYKIKNTDIDELREEAKYIVKHLERGGNNE